jgi:hypothetical protein
VESDNGSVFGYVIRQLLSAWYKHSYQIICLILVLDKLMDNCVPYTDESIVDYASHRPTREDMRQDESKYNMPANVDGTIDRKNDSPQLQNFLPSLRQPKKESQSDTSSIQTSNTYSPSLPPTI